MTRNDFLLFYTRLPDVQEQVGFLLKLSFYMTISARDTYVIQSDAVAMPTRLRGINEIQHKILGQALNLLSNRNKYPSDVFVGVLYDIAQTFGCIGDLESASNATVHKPA